MIFLNIGSNIPSEYNGRVLNINKTIKFLKLKKIRIKKTSHFYETPSYPDPIKPRFLNICLEVEFSLKPSGLLKLISEVETSMGRKRGKKNQPRVCDIDIIDFNSLIIKTKNIILPHPRTNERNFVLYPLQEICPNWKDPLSNVKIDNLITNLSFKMRNEITRMTESATID
jgi:2-amino-4-hydroxy-6-hydroxymethyldihydropteridine diphosphokinase